MPKSKHRRKPGRSARQVTADDLVLLRHSEEIDRRNSLVAHAALASMKAGHDVQRSWLILAPRLNLGRLATQLPEYAEHAGVVGAAVDAMKAIRARVKAMGDARPTPDECLAIGEALVLIDDLQHALPRRVIQPLWERVKAAGGDLDAWSDY